ncbi:MAG TPA: hypothetical protein VFL10_15550 [Ornithinibacter sp.]|nr:hypothetical protein [Ornithinibacter sp.]
MAGSWEELAEAASDLAVSARAEARFMDERRAALARNALVWWQGEAAEGYRLRVQERVNGLAASAVELEALARVADSLADGARSRAASEAAATLAPGGRG